MNRMKAELKLTDKQVEQTYADPEGAGEKLTALRLDKSIRRREQEGQVPGNPRRGGCENQTAAEG